MALGSSLEGNQPFPMGIHRDLSTLSYTPPDKIYLTRRYQEGILKHRISLESGAFYRSEAISIFKGNHSLLKQKALDKLIRNANPKFIISLMKA